MVLEIFRFRHLVRVLGLSVLVLACGGLFTLAGAASEAPRRGDAGGGQIPLWRLLPTHSFATLGVGHGSATHWAAYAYRSSANAVRLGNWPCIAVLGWTTESTILKNSVCGRVQPTLSAPDEPPLYALFGTSAQSHGRTKAESVFAAGVPSRVASIAVRFEDASGRKFARLAFARKLTRVQGQKARLRPFRYVVVSVGRNACVDSIVGYNAAGVVLFDLGEGECPLVKP